MNEKFRIGNGYDIHRLVENRALILGGVEILYEKGLLGHSDADVLTHAIMDAMLGALCLGDIGKHFPPDNPMYENISSLKLLSRVYALIKEEGYSINNIDSVIQAEKPKLLHHIPLMREKLSDILEISIEKISIKATTMEGLGAIGEEKAIGASSVVLLVKEK
jgi:2-C-methyl-D-erythritol 2,4-cyclodiphosphate synthase